MSRTMLDFFHGSRGKYEIESRRLASSQRLTIPAVKWDLADTAGNGGASAYAEAEYHGSAKKPYKLQACLEFGGSMVGAAFWVSCTCPDWLESGGWTLDPPRLCKHLLSWAKEMPMAPYPGLEEEILPVKFDPRKGDPAEVEPMPPLPFTDAVRLTVERAVQELAAQIWEISQIGSVPFLIGPTGCGKTSANRQPALDHGMAFIEHAGSDAWTESDLVGIVHVNGQKFPGPIAVACERAKQQKVHLLLDEFPRNNRRVQDGLMRFLLKTPAKVAEAMGVPCEGSDIHITSAPFWGDAWVKAEDISVCLAGNPWGTGIDPALIRRTEPVRVDFDQQVADNFSKRVRTAIQASWASVREGTTALPIEYQAMIKAKGPDDLGLIANYVRRLSFLDPAGADGYVSMLEGLSIGITRSDLQKALPAKVGGLGLLSQEAPLSF
jgi:hypothetical protein